MRYTVVEAQVWGEVKRIEGKTPKGGEARSERERLTGVDDGVLGEGGLQLLGQCVQCICRDRV